MQLIKCNFDVATVRTSFVGDVVDVLLHSIITTAQKDGIANME